MGSTSSKQVKKSSCVVPAQVETSVRGWIFVRPVPHGVSKDIFQGLGAFLLQSPQAFTHFGLLLSGQDPEGPIIKLEKLEHGVVFESIPSGSVLCNGAVVVREFSCTHASFKIMPFVQDQSAEYNPVNKNCKHLVHEFFRDVLGQPEDFVPFCRQVEECYADWVYHPLASVVLNAKDLPLKSTPLVAFESHHTDSLFFVGSPHTITELSRGQYNSWQWASHQHETPGATPGQTLVLVNRDSHRHIFYMKDDNILGEMYMGQSNNWTWSHHSHKVAKASKHAFLAGGANSGGLFVFWTGSGSLGEMHKGHYNNWTWNHSHHDAPVKVGQPITMVCSDNCKKVFWAGEERRMFEFHMGCYNGWTWELASHEIPETRGACHLASGCDSEGEHIFWASADGTISEMYNVKCCGWRWKTAAHTAPSVRKHQPLSLLMRDGKRVFWTDDCDNWQQLHYCNSRWAHKSLLVGGSPFLQRKCARS